MSETFPRIPITTASLLASGNSNRTTELAFFFFLSLSLSLSFRRKRVVKSVLILGTHAFVMLHRSVSLVSSQKTKLTWNSFKCVLTTSPQGTKCGENCAIDHTGNCVKNTTFRHLRHSSRKQTAEQNRRHRTQNIGVTFLRLKIKSGHRCNPSRIFCPFAAQWFPAANVRKGSVQ